MYPPSATVRNWGGRGAADNCRSQGPPTAAWSRGCSPDGTGRNRLALMAREAAADLGKQFAAHHVVAQVYGAGETFRVGAAVALDDDAVEAEENAAIRLARIHLLVERAERAARQQVAESPDQRTVHLALEQLAKLAGGALRGLERNVSGKTFGHHHIHRPLADIVALDEAEILELRPLASAQDLPGLADSLEPLHLLHPDIEEPDRRPIETE